MCLYKISKKIKPKGFGYKVFKTTMIDSKVVYKGIYFEHTLKELFTLYELGETYFRAEPKEEIVFGSVLTDEIIRYESGFHIYQDLKDAKINMLSGYPINTNKVIFKVSYPLDSVITTGYQDEKEKCVVVKQMKIEGEVKIKSRMV